MKYYLHAYTAIPNTLIDHKAFNKCNLTFVELHLKHIFILRTPGYTGQ